MQASVPVARVARLPPSSMRPGSELVELSCQRCGARLTPAMSGWRCPRLSACGYGGVVESVA